MVWYYAEGATQRGPVSEEEFEQMIRNGRLANSTLVWKDGMEDWTSLADAREVGLVTVPAPIVGSQVGTGGTQWPSGDSAGYVQQGNGLACMQCGRPVGPHNEVRYGNIVVCSDCAPGLSRMVLGNSAAGSTNAANYGSVAAGAADSARVPAFVAVPGDPVSRLIAKVLDNLVFVVFQLAVLFIFANPENLKLTSFDVESITHLAEALRPVILSSLAFAALYNTVMVATMGTTLGKLTMGMRVVDEKGNVPTWSQALTRGALPMVLQIPGAWPAMGLISSVCFMVLVLGYLSLLRDPLRRTWFDRLAMTRVIKR